MEYDFAAFSQHTRNDINLDTCVENRHSLGQIRVAAAATTVHLVEVVGVGQIVALYG